MTELIIIGIIALLCLILWGIFEEQDMRYKYKVALNELKIFSYFVGNCRITEKNKETVKRRLKEFRASEFASVASEFTDTLWKCEQLYIKRFLIKS